MNLVPLFPGGWFYLVCGRWTVSFMLSTVVDANFSCRIHADGWSRGFALPIWTQIAPDPTLAAIAA